MDFLNDGLEGVSLDPIKRQQLEVAVEEIFVNIAFYAYAPATGTVEIDMDVNPATSCMQICFKHTGVPFNPLARPDPDVKLPFRERERGGLGIYIVKKQLDSIDYAYEGGMNVLTLRKVLL